MKQLILSMAAVLIASSAFAHDVPQGQIAELGLHRLERLVILKKIESTYQTRSLSVSVDALNPADPSTDPSFKVQIAQGKAADASKKTLTLLADDDGKFLSFSVAGDKDPASVPGFNMKDAATLLEVSLHCVEGEAVDTSDLCSKVPELVQLNKKFYSANLSEVKNTAGTLIGAQVEVLGQGVNYRALLSLTLDGKLNGNNPVQIVALP